MYNIYIAILDHGSSRAVQWGPVNRVRTER